VIRALHTTKPHARYGYVGPFRTQAKDTAWTYLKEATKGILTEPPRESELRCKLQNGAWITIYGADNPDALRGLYFDGIVLDEFGDMKPSLMGEVIMPCLADRQGWLAIIGTAKGRNQFYEYRNKAIDSDGGWYYSEVKASESGVLPQSELDELLNVMGDEKYDQEMECNFDAVVSGTFYADLINRLQADGRLVDYPLYDPEQKVHVAADVGLRDSTAWWFWQPRQDGYAIIDYHEAAGQHMDYYLGMLHAKEYNYAEFWLPHDAKAKTLATRRSTVEQLRVPASVRPDLYSGSVVMPVRMVPKLSIQHGIDAARMILPDCWIDRNACARGIDCLRSYRRQFHEHTNTFSDSPLHDWASNGADGFRYLALVAKKSAAQMSEDPREKLARDLNRRPGYTLNQLFEDKDNGNWRKNIIRI